LDTGPLEVHKVQCNDCVHLKRGTATCDAFPDRIPDDILLGRHDHTEPYPGDHGIRFEPKEGTPE
jgi:hypothetical protein